jgi:peptidoglycan/xylan/chitin deacetylase (PgdA/CDA1 family)
MNKSESKGKATKPIASLSLDLDNKWSYMKTHSDPGWESYPSYLDILVPRVLDFLKERDLTITFFIVGQDAALAQNHEALQAIAAAGHEIGNHSFKHEQWLHLYTRPEIDADLALAEEHIERVTGHRPKGFRGPGFSLSADTLAVLANRGYVYDCSTFPTFLGPLARMYFFMTARLTPEEKEERKKLFGTIKDGLRPAHAYQWDLDDRQLIEIPVTTMPLFKVPFHMSYILYLSVYSTALALTYLRVALTMCRLTNTQPSVLLHPLDFLGGDEVPELAFFPAMHLPAAKKLAVVSRALEILATHYRPVPMRQHADQVSRGVTQQLVTPNFEVG